MDYTLPAEVDLTVDDLCILPDEFRYELIDGRLDIWDRGALSDLTGLALLASLRAACPPGFLVTACPQAFGGSFPVPHVVVTGPGGANDIRLVADGVRADWGFAELRMLFAAYERWGVPRYWIVEAGNRWLTTLTEFVATGAGEFDSGATTGGIFTSDAPYPVAVDLPAMSSRWPETFEYAGRRADAE